MTEFSIVSRAIALTLLDEPTLPARESFDEAKLDELVESIRVYGLIEPLVVKAANGRYEVIAGHRRLLACRRAALTDVPCVVRDVDAATAEGIKVAENEDREEVNPAATATYFSELLDRYCHNDVDELCAFVRRSRSYVENRLLLFRGAPEVLEAVRAGEISLAVATELNRFPDRAGAKMHLESAKAGSTARQVRQWRTDYTNFLERQKSAGVSVAGAGAPAAGSPAMTGPECICCRRRENNHRLVAVYVHDYCDLAVLEPLLRTFRGEKEVIVAP